MQENQPGVPPFSETVIPTAAADNVPQEWQIGDRLLDLYDVVAVLGEGGMGKVYQVHHRGWNMDLAVKSPKPQVFTRAGGRENFVREAETWMSLGLHPHIVSCYYVRTLGGFPRIFAEYVAGGNLAEWIRNRKLYEGGQKRALERMLDVAIQFAWGLHFAHEKGLIHQDIKPANVMLTAEGLTKVTDFGLAKARAMAGEGNTPEPSQSILVSSRGMTPAYCSPEQAAHQPLSRKTDIWSWGVSVLEMFVGNVTWRAGVVAREVLASHQRHAMIPEMPPDVVTLLSRCFQPRPEDRPATMLEVASQLQAIYKRLLSQRYPREAPRAADLLADSLNNRALSFYDLGKREQARQTWEQALQSDPQHLETFFNAGLLRWRQGQWTDEELITRLKELQTVRGKDADILELIARVHSERGDRDTALSTLFEEPQASPFTNTIPEKESQTLRDLRDQIKSRTGDWGGCIKVIETRKGQTAEADQQTSIATSFLFPGGNDALLVNGYGEIFFADLESGEIFFLMSFSTDSPVMGEKAQLDLVDRQRPSYMPPFYVHGRPFVWENRALICRSTGEFVLWDLAARRCLRVFGNPTQMYEMGVSVHVEQKQQLIIAREDTVLEIWDLKTGKCLKTIEKAVHPTRAIRSRANLCVSRDGRLALLGEMIGIEGAKGCILQLWDLENERRLALLEDVAEMPLCFTPDGRFAITSAPGCEIHIRAVPDLRIVRILRGHSRDRAPHVRTGQISPDGRFLLTGGLDHTIRLWELSTGRCLRTFREHDQRSDQVQWSADGKHALSTGNDGTASLWEIPQFKTFCHFRLSRQRSHTELSTTEAQATALFQQATQALEETRFADALELARRARALPGWERAPKSVALWEKLSKRTRRAGFRSAWPSRRLEGDVKHVAALTISADGQRAAAVSSKREIRVWDLASGRCLHCWQMPPSPYGGGQMVTMSANGKYVFSGSIGFDLQIWDVESGICLHQLEGHPHPDTSPGAHALLGLSLSPDGHYAFSTATDQTMRWWNRQTGRMLRSSIQGALGGKPIVASPDGRFLFVGGTVTCVVDFATGQEVRQFRKWSQRVASRLSADGHRALSINSVTGLPSLLETETGNQLQVFEGHTDPQTYRRVTTLVLAAELSADGRVALTSGRDKTVRLWDTSSGACLSVLQAPALNPIFSLCLAPDASFALIPDETGIAVWHFDWDLQALEPVDWDEGVMPYAQVFLTLHTPYAGQLPEDRQPTEQEVQQALTRAGRPVWTEEDFQHFLAQLQDVGYGWLRPTGIRNRLEHMTRTWTGPASVYPASAPTPIDFGESPTIPSFLRKKDS